MHHILLFSQRSQHHRFYGVHAVFRLVENHRPGGFEYFICHFQFRYIKTLAHLLADLGFEIVEGGQAVEENSLGSRGVHHVHGK